MDSGERRDQEPPAACPLQQWREDFPIDWENDHYITRRELTKFLTFGSGLLAAANAAIVLMGLRSGAVSLAPARIAEAGAIPPGGSLLFRYPTDEDPCILVRSQTGGMHAYSQRCTHLSCAVVHHPERNTLFCPCHKGYFTLEEGRPTAGPPIRPLPRIALEEREGGIYAVGIEVGDGEA
jgi:arsenite oxidase small subunit